MCIPKACGKPTTAGVWWRDDAEWKRYDDAQAGAIRAAIAGGLPHVDLGTLLQIAAVQQHAHHGAHYVVDLREMMQRNVDTGHTRSIKVVDDEPAVDMTSAVQKNARLHHAELRVKELEKELLTSREMIRLLNKSMRTQLEVIMSVLCTNATKD